MKFVCERCHTKYSIADDKVRQKILKIRCKTCENVITIRDAVVVNERSARGLSAADLAAVSVASMSADLQVTGTSETGAVEWHLAVNGKQEGPFGIGPLCKRLQTTSLNDEIYVWSEHLDGWKEPKAVPEIAAELRARAASTPPPPPPGARPGPAPGRNPFSASSGAAPGPTGPTAPGGPARPSASMAAVTPGNLARPSSSMAAVTPGSPVRPSSSMPAVAPGSPARPSSSMAAVPPGSLARPSSSMPAVGARPRPSAAMPAVGQGARAPAPAAASVPSAGRPSARAMPSVALDSFEEDGERTQISSPDMRTMMPEPERPRPTTGSLTVPGVSPPGPDKNGNGASKAFSATASSTGLEALDFVPVPVSSSPSAAWMAPLGPSNGPSANASGVVASPVVGGTTSMLLSQIGGRAARVRHPAIKYAVTGSVLVVLLISVGVITMTTTPDKPRDLRKTAANPTATNPGADPESVARAQAEEYFKNMVGGGETPSPNARTIGPPAARRPVPARPRPSGDPTRPPPIAPPPVGTAPVASSDTGVAHRFGDDERRVAVPHPGGGHPSPGAGGSFDQQKFAAVFRQPDHYGALKSCYERALKRDQSLRQGRLDIAVTIGEMGGVKSVRLDNAPAEFNSMSGCIRDTVRRWHFQATSSEYSAVMPFIFQGSSE